ncbi:MAG: hypothetical protein JHC81_04820 [Brevundimonas sp.]|uniref:hypothetical protein n=1 Tax=Brevundimonas sp. TaxID=1871086 RepID=UPI001A28C5DB|nr:hypothetical protein [Brevundimonas sp.]MBJ7446837.1 hypothetical protein [Brevundimonas sp.]
MSIEEPIDVLSEADPDTERRLGAFPNPSLAECPVVPLGFDGGKVIFAMPEGEIRVEMASKIAGMLRPDIFCCQAGQSFLGYWRDSEDKFQRDLATVWFNRKCREAGKWDANRPQRSLGVWPGEGGTIVLHKGDEIWRYPLEGEVEKLSIADALREKRGALYRLRPPAPAPGKPASSADGAWLRDQLDMWRFEAIGDDGLTGGDVVAGWLMAALLGAVAPFRGHLLIHALAGSGKTTFLMLIEAALSALAGEIINSFSEAGFRADISGMARPAVVDEAESSGGDNGPGPVEQVLNLLRLMATGAGANRKMGDVGGGAIAQTAVGSVLMAAVLPPKMDSALATRVAEIRMLPLNGSDLDVDEVRPALATDPTIKAAIGKARELAPALLGRALTQAHRYRADAAAVKEALIAGNEAPRTADLIAMLAAGRRLLMFDTPLTPQEATEEVAFWRPLLDQRAASEAVSNPGADALAHWMNWPSGKHIRDRQETLGEIVARQCGTEREYDALLKAHGAKVYAGAGKDGREGPWLLIANHHPVLDRIFGRTQWKDYRKTLAYLDAIGPEHRTWATVPQTFGVGVKQRAIAIPLTPWLEKASRGVPGSVPSSVPGEGHEF